MRLDSALGLELNRLETDFHIPDLDQDSRLAIDPFLMFKSRHENLVAWHDALLAYFRHVLALVQAGLLDRALAALTCPEPREIRLGYTAKGTAGSGVGPAQAGEVVRLLETNPLLLDRGIRHLEELQLYTLSIGADRLSDLVCNVLKLDLARYTERQADMWGIPTRTVGLSHGWNHESAEWVDAFADLPLDPDSGAPVLLVPRRVLRRLPWINYEDFRSHHLLGYLPSTFSHDSLAKTKVVDLTRKDITLVDRYVDKKEESRQEAAPIDLDDRDKTQVDAEADDFGARLQELPTGRPSAKAFEELVLRILNTGLEPELIDGRPQQRTEGGTQIRDIIFLNDSDHSFWQHVRQAHSSLLVTFELKNKAKLTAADLNQLHAYLGDSTGYLGFIVSRLGFAAPDLSRARALYNRRSPHSVILSISDADLIALLRWRKTTNGPTEFLREKYRAFMTSIQ